MTESCRHCKKSFVTVKSAPDPFGSDEIRDLEIPDCNCAADIVHKAYLEDVARQKKDMLEARYNRLNLGEFDDFASGTELPEGVWSDPVAAARDGYHLIAQGDSGNGKTTLLKRIAHDLIWAGVRVVGGYVPDLLGAIKTDIKDNSEETFGWMSRGEVLLLDDIDKLSGSRFEVERLLTTIDNYSRKKQAILVSTNMTLIRLSEELQTNKWSVPKEHAKALISRLADKADVVTKKAVSFRKVHEHLTDAPVVAKPVDGVSGEELE